jgi:hypothetical protein
MAETNMDASQIPKDFAKKNNINSNDGQSQINAVR